MPEAAGAPVRIWAAERNRIVRGGRFGGSVVAFLLAVSLAAAARAGVPIDPGDAIALPPGSTVAAGYYQFITADGYQLDLPGAGLITAQTHLNEQLGIFRLIRYASLGGVEIAPQLILPYGSLYGGAIGGVPLPGATGFADPILGLTEWLVNDHRHRRYVTVTEYLTLPAGSYEPGRTLNLGGNRWVGDLQLGYHQGLGPRVALGFALDATFYGDNSRAGTGRQTLTEAPSYEAQSWLEFRFSRAFLTALGYDQTFGGRQKLAGVYTGQETYEGTLRIGVQQYLSRHFQLEAIASHDVVVLGGFRENFTMQIRIVAAF